MALSDQLASQVSRNARHRGETYRMEGRVLIARESESGVSAIVRGTERYQVDLEWEDTALLVRCDCPFFYDNAIPCKHVWATLLVAEEQGLPEKASSVKKLTVDLDDFPLDEDDVRRTPMKLPRNAAVRPSSPALPPPPAWKAQLGALFADGSASDQSFRPWPSNREILYIIEIAQSRLKEGLVLSLSMRDQKKNGEWSVLKPLSLKGSEIGNLSDEDRQIVSNLRGGQQYYQYGVSSDDYYTVPQSFMLRPDLALSLLPRLARSGRAFLRADAQAPPEHWLSLSWDDADPWGFEVQVVPASKEDAWLLQGALRRGEQKLELEAATLLVPGLAFVEGRAAPLDTRAGARDTWKWIAALRQKRPIRIPRLHEAEFLEHLLTSKDLPRISLPPELTYEEVSGDPLPHLSIARFDGMRGQEMLRADLSFEYAGQIFTENDARRGNFDSETRRFFARNQAAERQAAQLLDQLGSRLKAGYWDSAPRRELNPKKLPVVVRELLHAGWRVEAEGAVFRKPAAFRVEVSSGVDWFELHGQADYEGVTAKLPELLAALRRGDNMVRLDDGSFGMLPEEWLQKIAPLAGMGETTDGHIRFQHAQTGLLDALLAAQPEARCDETFSRIREQWHSFQGIAPAQQPAGFVGRLREYQAEGLGWMHFLHKFNFGGCLADDMGVGKTAQVLALLEERRQLRAAGELAGPSLVVVPRSLVFNWKEEATRFTPSLSVLDYTAPSRGMTKFEDYDLVLTTYGTLRRDIAHLKDVEFDYVVLDEAQAVKNAATVSSKAVRLLRGRNRLALSGTPVENHLGELWTLFEFLNPGMLGASGAFRGANGNMRNPDEDTRRMLARAVRPFILRRTKEQVARELPAKTEQTVYCELDPAHRELYDELREHYRRSLLGSRPKWEKSKLQVLEALLRLRQAACHPGLLDPSRVDESSAKLEVLWEQISEVLEGGHKALVFSQFTSLLKIVRARLDREQIAYEYLDGATRDRKAAVERFQADEICRLFLISLKAGGLGLNLTAAEYVFILDPWWNPAAEAQAVDRAHRIGQERPVFAYRIIARDTVEEKVLELQKSKRDLADAIVGADNNLIRDLKPEDLAMLLS